MRHEWRPRSSDTLRRASDEDGDFPGFWIQALDGAWRYLPYAGIEAAAEILRLAERVKELEEDARAATMTTEEGNEIIGELSMALAILAGEDLKPCMAPCRGHLRAKANEAMKAALAAWRALQEGNRCLREAGAGVLRGFDEGVFVRDIGRDHEGGWAMRTVKPLAALGRFAQVLGRVLTRCGCLPNGEGGR